MSEGKKILILDGFEEGMMGIGALTRANHRAYAMRHGYSFETVRTYKSGTHSSWQKLEIILGHLDQYGKIVWLDADVVVTNPMKRVEDIGVGREGILCSADWCDAGISSFSSGIVIATSCDGTKEVIMEAMKRTKWENVALWDQSALQEVWQNDDRLRQVFHILPRRELNSVPKEVQKSVEPWESGDFLCHLTGISQEARMKLFWKYDLEGIKKVLGRILPWHETGMMMDLRHFALIKEIITRRKWESALEIGVWKGAGTDVLIGGLESGSLGKLTCCDILFQKEFLGVVEGKVSV